MNTGRVHNEALVMIVYRQKPMVLSVSISLSEITQNVEATRDIIRGILWLTPELDGYGDVIRSVSLYWILEEFGIIIISYSL